MSTDSLTKARMHLIAGEVAGGEEVTTAELDVASWPINTIGAVVVLHHSSGLDPMTEPATFGRGATERRTTTTTLTAGAAAQKDTSGGREESADRGAGWSKRGRNIDDPL